MLDIVILTDLRYENPDPSDTFIADLLLEDELLFKAFNKVGLKTRRVAWDNPDFDWSTTRYAIFRSTWNYIDHFEKFTDWLNKVSSKLELLNDHLTIKWNCDKHYLLELEEKGIRIAPTLFIPPHSSKSLIDILKTKKWQKTVLKPVISGGGKHTYKIDAHNLHQIDALFKDLNKADSFMLQPFQEHIISKGEISINMINGQFTHAILKKAKTGDFRVQSDFGGVIEIYHPNTKELEFARRVLKTCSTEPIYARIDIFYDNDNQIALAELELIEPELWFRLFPPAADLLADAVKKRIS